MVAGDPGHFLYGLSLSTLAEVHPYDRWAKELGIDMNVSYDGTRLMEFQGNKFSATERRTPGFGHSFVGVGEFGGNPLLSRVESIEYGLVQEALQQPYEDEKVECLRNNGEPVD